MSTIPKEWIDGERRLLAEALRAALVARPRERKMVLRKVSELVERTWVSAGCFGEAVQWRLAKRPAKPKRKRKQQDP